MYLPRTNPVIAILYSTFVYYSTLVGLLPPFAFLCLSVLSAAHERLRVGWRR